MSDISNTTNARIEANANLTLWCVHVLGPDDVHAAPTHAEAVAHAAELNTAIFSRDAPVTYDNDILCFCYAAPWPHTPESHAKDLPKWKVEP